jgi:hypothetical protein
MMVESDCRNRHHQRHPSRLIALSIAMTWFACLLGATAPLHAEELPATRPVEVPVVHITSDRFPVLSDQDVAKVLEIAGTMIKTGFGREVRFVGAPTTRKSADDFFADLHRRIDPMTPQSEELFDPFKDDLQSLYPSCLRAVHAVGDLKQVSKMLGHRDDPFTDEPSAARALMAAYGGRLSKLKALRATDGSPRINPATCDRASLSYWEIYLCFGGAKDEMDVNLYNGLLIEDSRVTAGCHSLAMVTVNGMAYPVANNAVVGYFPLMSDDPDIRSDHLGKLTPDQRLTAIAFVIAHEVGAHLIMKRMDDYVPSAGLTRPLLALDSKDDVMSYETWQRATAKPRPLNEMYFRCMIARTRIGIAAMQGDLNALDPELHVLDRIAVDETWKSNVEWWATDLYERARATSTTKPANPH